MLSRGLAPLTAGLLFSFLTAVTSAAAAASSYQAIIEPNTACNLALTPERSWKHYQILDMNGPFGNLVPLGLMPKVIKTVQNEFGDTSYQMRRLNTNWNSRRVINDNPAGDLRNFSKVLGQAPAEFFGRYLLSHFLVQVPGADLLNRKIDVFNAGQPASKQIKIRFFKTDNFELDYKTFVIRFVREHLYPNAESGFYLNHDAAYHHLSIFLPPELAANSFAVYGLQLEFVEYLVSKLAGPPSSKTMEFVDQLYNRVAKKIDQLGNLMLYEKSYGYNPDRLSWYFEPVFIKTFLFDGAAPVQALVKNFTEIYPNVPLPAVNFETELKEFLALRGERRTLEAIKNESPLFSKDKIRELFGDWHEEIGKRVKILTKQKPVAPPAIEP